MRIATCEPIDASTPRTFFYSLDGIRAIAAFMVVLLHTAPLYGIDRPQESYLAVDLFFALSGVVICHTYESRLLGGMTLGRFAWIRTARLYPLYFVGTALSAIALLLCTVGLLQATSRSERASRRAHFPFSAHGP